MIGDHYLIELKPRCKDLFSSKTLRSGILYHQMRNINHLLKLNHLTKTTFFQLSLNKHTKPSIFASIASQ